MTLSQLDRQSHGSSYHEKYCNESNNGDESAANLSHGNDAFFGKMQARTEKKELEYDSRTAIMNHKSVKTAYPNNTSKDT